jgi:hypothetical protein
VPDLKGVDQTYLDSSNINSPTTEILIVEHRHITDAHIRAKEKHLTAIFFAKSLSPFCWWLGIFRSGN